MESHEFDAQNGLLTNPTEDTKVFNHENQHEHHQQVLNRLARIEGHVHAIKRMVEKNSPCPDVLLQIAAVRSALNRVGRVILEDHLESCMIDAVEKDDYIKALQDLKISLNQFIG